MGMLNVMEQPGTFASQFERIEQLEASDPAWLNSLRRAAFARFAELGFPSTRHEEWRHTSVRAIAEADFVSGDIGETAIDASDLAPFLLNTDGPILVFINGCFSAELSSTPTLNGGVRVETLANALSSDASILEKHLGQHASFEDDAFVALNTALMQDGAFVHVPAGTVLDAPIQLLYVSTAKTNSLAIHPRNLFQVGKSAQATIVESHVGIDSGTYFTNPVTEIVLGENGVVDHYKFVHETEQGLHVGAMHLQQSRNSNATSHVASVGGKLVRNNMTTALDGEGCQCTINGLTMIGGNDHVDNHLVVDHAQPHCDSWEYFKSILDGKSRGIFSGRINVRKGAQKTDAKQTNMTLLLSDTAKMQAKPQLEIFADDVKCTHGATIGQISQEAIFYLQTRGIAAPAARSLLTYAFARENIDKIKVASLQAKLHDLLIERLPDSGFLREVV